VSATFLAHAQLLRAKELLSGRYVQAQANTSAAASVPVDDQRLVRVVDKIIINQPNR
jgi:hypothetical protein